MTVLVGDWSKVKRWFRRTKARVFFGEYDQAMRELGSAINLRVQQHIQNQDLDWKPLADATIAKKGHDMVYIETGDYIRSVRSQVSRKGPVTLNLEVKPTGTHPSSGMDMQALAALLEYGTPTIDPRPIWGPVMEEVQKMEEFKDLFETLKSKLEFSNS